MNQLSIWDDLVKDQSEHEEIQKKHREKQQKRIEDGKQNDENFKWFIDDAYSDEAKGFYTTMEPGKTYIKIDKFQPTMLYKIHEEQGELVYKQSKNGKWRWEEEPFYLVFGSHFIEVDEDKWWSLSKEEKYDFIKKTEDKNWIG